MRNARTILAAAAGLLLAAPAAAGPGDPFNGIDVSIIDKSTGSAIVWELPAGNTSKDVEDEVFIIVGGALSGSHTRTVPATTGLVTATRITYSNAAATISPGSSLSMPLLGTWSLLGVGGTTLVSLPLNVVGAGGTTAVTAPFPVSLRGGLWSTGAATITGLTNPLGGTPATVTTAGFDARTPAGLGTVRWVTPVVIQTSLGSEAHFLQLDVTYVPEPAGWATAGLGVLLCLGRCGQLRRRGREAAP